jgi:type IV pilus assembly protein PilN
MIRINLVAPERPTQKKAKVSAGAPGAFQLYFFLAIFAGGAAVVDGGLWWLKKQQIAKLGEDIEKAKKRQKELEAIKKQVDDLEAKRNTLKMKNDLIDRLRREQSDPVHMLDEISKALPDLVWLAKMEQGGSTVNITGLTNGLTAVADFMSGLQRSGWFPQVDMGPTKEAAGGTGVLDFVVKATFKNPETAAKAAAEAAAAAARPAGTPAPPGRPAARRK